MAAFPIGKLLYEEDVAYLSAQKYSIDDVLGSGSFGVVFKVRHTSPTGEQSTCSLKAIKYVGSDRKILREIYTGRVVRHFHCVASNSFLNHRGIFYIEMEFCPGGSLANYLANNPRPTCRRVQQIGKELGSALHYLHDAGIAHRDVKPDNILLDGHRRVKLCDYGLAKYLSTSLRNTNCGSHPYKPPEMFVKRANVFRQAIIECDPYKHDVWSFGAVLYEMLTGHLPFTVEELDVQWRTSGTLDVPTKLAELKDREDEVTHVFEMALTIKYENRSSMCNLMRMPWLSGYVAPPPPPRPES